MKDYKTYTGMITVRSGKSYPDFALGTYLRTEKELEKLLSDYPFDKLMLDTAYRYGNEHLVASAIEKSRYPVENIYFIGKINTGQQESGKTVKEELQATLNRLNLRKIHIYLIHSDRSTKIVNTWTDMISLQKLGLIDTIGVSNFSKKSVELLYSETSVYPEIIQILPQKDPTEKTYIECLRFFAEKQIHVQIAAPFRGESNSKGMSNAERCDILKRIRSKGFSCVFGTTNNNHLYENVSWLGLGR